MSNILLITPSNKLHTERQNWSSPHLGIWRIAGWLEKHGHSSVVHDAILDDELPEGEFDIIGFSLTHDTLPDDISLMRKISQKHEEAYIVVGGCEASTNYQHIFEHVPKLDYAVIGEGEKAMLYLADSFNWHYRKLGGVPLPGSISRTYTDITLSDFTAYNFALPFGKMRYQGHWKIVKELKPDVTERELYCVRLNTSTFCNKACKFCSITHTHKMASGHTCKPITMTGEDTKELVRKIVSEIPETRSIYFNDDSFTTDPRKAEEFFDNPPKLDYHIQARVDEVDRYKLAYMSDGGCRRISFGVENCSPHVLKDIGKGTSTEQTDQVLMDCETSGISPIVLIMLFCPTSTIEDMVLNYNQLKEWENRGITLSIMSYIRPYHGSWYLNSGLHEILWERVGGIKRPRALLPDDPDVRKLWYEFEKRLSVLEREIPFHWKGHISSIMLEVLGDLLKEGGAL